MLGDLISKLWRRPKERRRIQVKLPVRTVDADGTPVSLESEDIGDTGFRLRSSGIGLAALMGHREEMPFEIRLWNDTSAARADARLVWAYRSDSGDTISGWNFVEYHGDSRRAIADFIDSESNGT